MVVMSNFTPEICRKGITVARNEETISEWCNSHLAVRTPKGVHIYEFSHNLESIDKQLDCIESFIATPTSSPSRDIYDCKLVRYGLKNRDISEMMLDTAMWGHSPHMIQEMTNVILFKFSPPGLIRNTHSALAILNNIGNVEMYTIGRKEWISVLDFSSCIKDQFEECLKEAPKTFDELKEMAYKLATSSICWAPKVKNDYCYFVTSQKSGVLLFWLMQNQEDDVTAKYCGKIELAFGEIIHLNWISKSENKFLLLCSNISGQVMVLECQINKKHVILLKSHMLWEHKDRMIVKFSEYRIEENRIVLLYNKHRHIIAQLIDESNRVISQSVDNINDYRLTSLGRNKNEYFVTTVNFKFYKVNISTDNNVLQVTFDNIDVKDTTATMELYNVGFSANGVICSLLALDRRVMHKKDPLQMQIIFLQTTSDQTVLETLLHNPTKKLADYWDCIELLRYRMVKLKALPSLDVKTLLGEDENDVYRLKIYLVLLKICTNLVNNIKISNDCKAKSSIEHVKDKILLFQANTNIQKLHNKCTTGKSLNPFEMECYAGSKNYLNFYSKKYETPLRDLITLDKLNLNVDDCKYTCQCCEEQIDNFSCPNKHFNMFCSLTFTPIEGLEYIVCKYCNLTARIETYSEKPVCLFCDYKLEMHNFCE